MAKKKSSSRGKASRSTRNRCAQGGGELTPIVLSVSETDTIRFRLILCRALARVRVLLDGEVIALEEGMDAMDLLLPPLAPGSHLLHWSFQTPGDVWQTKAEILINGTVRFRHRKNSDSEEPFNSGFMFFKDVTQ